MNNDITRAQSLIPQLNTSIVFAENFNVSKKYGEHINVVVNQGGTSSGKTFSLMQLMFVLCLLGRKMRPDRSAGEEELGHAITIRVVAKHFTSLRNDAMEIAERLQDEFAKIGFYGIGFNKSTHVFVFPNKSSLKFIGLDNSEKAKFGKYDYTYICEATSLQHEVYSALQVRTFQMTFIDYNPSFKFWVHTKVLFTGDDNNKIANPAAILFRSTYKNNPYLSANIIANIEANKNNENWWRVYGMGFTGKVEGLVFTNWKMCEEFPVQAKGLSLGLDFGFNDPTALVLVGYYDGAIYLKEILYKSGVFNEDIADAILKTYDWLHQNGYTTSGLNGSMRVIADSAQPKDIELIKRIGGGRIGIQAAKKGSGSINSGISFFQSLPIYITKDSPNLINEFMTCEYEKDTVTGKMKPTIKPGNDHALDAARYASESESLIYSKLNDQRKKRNLQIQDNKKEEPYTRLIQ